MENFYLHSLGAADVHLHQGICRYAIDYTSQMYDQYLLQIKLPFGVNWVRGDIIMCSESIVTGDLVSSWLAVSIS